ncbi:sulfate permease, SulP family [Andreprevotia lacus DSM 23236]|jgi:SulP family sulfate permease|uniref:Sulfate permease, SulP family n=1 Tax=Andreprevotia lacus DSM 23236 TaxID=1121001 RepID=A0A1W1XI29_9NEIS|nr:SulP family inorganic anion transporter [Andreprevotia lacus]SMC23161.1 sulfate permease, SulP family [Andreprevotia lacus DSM 23236]
MNTLRQLLPRLLPIAGWLPRYTVQRFGADLAASVVVAVLLIPQSVAYALIAGLPPQAGLYASTLPLLVYALLGSSMTQSVGPMALTSLMTASAIAPLIASGMTPQAAAAALALISGAALLGFGLLRLGFLTHFLSLPVVSGFTSGTALLIAAGQWHTLFADAASFGVIALALLVFSSDGLPRLLPGGRSSWLLARAAPLLALILLTVWAAWHGGISTLGSLPAGLPGWQWPAVTLEQARSMLLPAMLVGLVGFLQSITIAQTLALQRQETLQPDQELIALGASNIAAACVGGLPVSGGFSRTAVNAQAGAQTPLAGVMTAGWIMLAALWLGQWLALIPKAALAATIMLAAFKLLDWRMLRATWQFSRRDVAALVGTLLATVLLGAVEGVAIGVLLSLALFIYRTSRPQVVQLGRLPGSEHFRNVRLYEVETHPGVLLVRIDEQLYFGNTRHIESALTALLAEHGDVRDLVLVLSAVNDVDFSGADWLMRLQPILRTRGIRIHLAEVKARVRKQLERGHVLQALDGEVFLSSHQAFCTLATGHTPDYEI